MISKSRTPKIRIMLVEDFPDYRRGIACALDGRADMELASEFGTAEIALRSLREIEKKNAPDIILLDLNLPGMSGLDAILEFKQQAPDTKIIILTQSDKEADVLRAIRLGASGYMLKSTSIKQLTDGIQCVHKGGATLDPSLARFILSTLNKTLPKKPEETDLSKRELEIITLIAEGLAQKQIASQLQLSIYTVTEYIRKIYEKLQVPNAPSAISKAFRSGILPTETE
jgi:DNA-binding NarL/FixJ family response regulator